MEEEKKDPISKAFNLEPFEKQHSGQIAIPDPNDDYNYARQVVIDMLEKRMKDYSEFSQVASSAQEPRFYEVLNLMGDSIVDDALKLMMLKKQDQDIKEREERATGPQSVTQNLYVGSTAELLEIYAAKAKKVKDEDETGQEET